MPWLLRLNTLVVLLLAGLFCCFFSYAKHDPLISSLIPFANDPYDSVASFGAIMCVLLGILALMRGFWLYRKLATAAQKIFLVRTQMAIVLAVLISIAGDATAMARHPSRWLGHPGAQELLLLMAGMTVLALGVGLRTRRSVRETSPSAARQWRWAIVTISIFAAVLAIFPEEVIRSVSGELFALATGIVLLFLPLSALIAALIPFALPEEKGNAPSSRVFKPWVAWAGAALAGTAIGGYLLFLEAQEGGGVLPARLLLVAAVFIGAGTAGLVTAYAFLRKPLGLFL